MTQKRHRILSIALGAATYLLLWVALKSLLSIEGKEKISAVALMIPISIFKFFMKDPQENATESARIQYQNSIDAYSGYVLTLIFTLLYYYSKP